MNHILNEGGVLERPKAPLADMSPNAFEELYALMKVCWSLNPSDRPTLEAIDRSIKLIVEGTVDGDYFSGVRESLKAN